MRLARAEGDEAAVAGEERADDARLLGGRAPSLVLAITTPSP
jgi:hypothetical protein